MCVRLQGVVSSVRPGRQGTRQRKKSVISAPSKLSWWINSKNVRTFYKEQNDWDLFFHE